MTRTIKDITASYVQKHSVYERKERAIESQIKEAESLIKTLKAKKNGLEYPFWNDCLVKPIAEELVKRLPNTTYEILGPFGIGARTSIHFYKKGISETQKFQKGNCRSITFEPTDLNQGLLSVVDEKTDTDSYSKNSLGELNGFNHPTILLAVDTSIQELLTWVK